jgi:5'-nucleotidase
LISILRRENRLTADYPARAQALFDEYHPIEIDHNVPLAEKVKAMEAWWRAHFVLLVESGMTMAELERAVMSAGVQLRDGVANFFQEINKHNVPIVIISAAGLGEEAIALYLRERNLLSDNVHIVSNGFEWSETGHMIAFKEPVIHTCNKNETVLKDFSFYPQIEKRKNVLLLGDSLEDVAMAAGIEHTEVLKIGFLNKNIEENQEKFLQTYDAVVVGDGDFMELNKIILGN